MEIVPGAGGRAPARAGALVALGVVAVVAAGAAAAGTSGGGATGAAAMRPAPVVPEAPGPGPVPAPVAAVAGEPTRRVAGPADSTPVVLGAGLTRAEAARRAERILRDAHLAGQATVDLKNWPNIVTVRSSRPVPDTVTTRLGRELGIWLVLTPQAGPSPP